MFIYLILLFEMEKMFDFLLIWWSYFPFLPPPK